MAANILATLCYVRREGKTLMLHRNKKERDLHANKWNGLGGKLKTGESPEECEIRELEEESGLIAKHLVLKGILTFPKFDQTNDWYVFVFTVDDFSGDIKESPEGTLHWIEDEKLLDLNLWEGDRIFLPLVYKNKSFSGKFIYENGKLREHQILSN